MSNQIETIVFSCVFLGLGMSCSVNDEELKSKILKANDYYMAFC